MIEDFKITDNFWFYEMTDSEDYPGLVEENRRIAFESPSVLESLTYTCRVLEKVRRRLDGTPVYIESGFRHGELNAKIGGSHRSQHLYGQAADFFVLHHDMLDVWEDLRRFLINDDGKPMYHQMYFDKERGFIHLGLATGYNDGQHWVQ